MCFWKALFSALGRPLGTQGVQEAPKLSQNGIKMVPAGTLREVLEPSYLLYGRHMGGLGQALGLQTLFGNVLGGVFSDLGSCWVPSGVPGSPFWSKNGEYF